MEKCNAFSGVSGYVSGGFSDIFRHVFPFSLF